MKQQDVCLVELQPGHAEYDMVAKKFNQTCSQCKIEKVSLLLTWSFLNGGNKGYCGPGYIHFDSFPISFLNPELEYIMVIRC